jgi:hypothetical protein
MPEWAAFRGASLRKAAQVRDFEWSGVMSNELLRVKCKSR